MEADRQLLLLLREQEYPLMVSQETALALVNCITRVMDAVPDDDRIFVRAEYNLATSSLCHPEWCSSRTNYLFKRC